MYRIITLDGTELGMTDSVLYIKLATAAVLRHALLTKRLA